MNNTELCERLLAVQKELDTLEKYVGQHFLVDERVDYRLLGALAATRNAANSFTECIDDIYTYDNKKARR